MAFDTNAFYFSNDMPDFMIELGGMSDKTALGYAKDYIAFFQANYGAVDKQAIEAFLELDTFSLRKQILGYYAKRRTASPATLARMSSSLRALIGAARAHGATTLSPQDVPRPTRKPEAYRDTSGISANELRTMIGACTDVRDKAILMLLGALGLRRAEVACLMIGDYIRLKNGGALMVSGKGMNGQKDRMSISEPLCALIDSYLATRSRTKNSDPLFLGRHKEGISEVGISYIVKTAAKMAGIAKDVSPHRLRHSAATMALDSGMGLDQVQALMRHKSPSTTRIYDDNKQRYDGVAATNNVSMLLA
jgi:integrase/recombinase XerC